MVFTKLSKDNIFRFEILSIWTVAVVGVAGTALERRPDVELSVNKIQKSDVKVFPTPDTANCISVLPAHNIRGHLETPFLEQAIYRSLHNGKRGASFRDEVARAVPPRGRERENGGR